MFTNLYFFGGGEGADVHQISRNMYCRFLILYDYLSPQFCHLVSNSRVTVLVADVKSFHIIREIYLIRSQYILFEFNTGLYLQDVCCV